jgi:hypothetical protein
MFRKALFSTTFVSTVCLAAVLTGMPVVAGDETVTLSGEIQAAKYDEDGNPVSVMIFDSEWGEVLISSQGQGQKLLDQVGAFVELTGSIVELEDDSRFSYAIQVDSFTIVEPAEPEYDEDWNPEE